MSLSTRALIISVLKAMEGLSRQLKALLEAHRVA
jgi:hypothetical protein